MTGVVVEPHLSALPRPPAFPDLLLLSSLSWRSLLLTLLGSLHDLLFVFVHEETQDPVHFPRHSLYTTRVKKYVKKPLPTKNLNDKDVAEQKAKEIKSSFIILPICIVQFACWNLALSAVCGGGEVGYRHACILAWYGEGI